ncbi:MAG: exo-beta-N-acetylmuramidase NamZ domain-containing protein, partial [Aquirufa sp.]
MSRIYKLIFLFLIFSNTQLFAQIPGAYATQRYLPLLTGKKVALVVNHTSVIGRTHVADSLLALGIKIQKIFAPEHGFRGDADAG